MTQRHDVSYQRLVEIRHLSAPDSAKRVLLVDDNENAREALADALEQEGYEVVAVGNGLEALDLLRWSWRPACVLLDMRMPVMTGWELRQKMEADPSLRDICVIGMTAGRWKAQDAAGFAALIPKPINIKELLGTLKRCNVPGTALSEDRTPCSCSRSPANPPD
jgi:CheY-like chemotaxis protein